MNYKIFLSILLVAVFALTVVSCGKGDNETTTEAEASSTKIEFELTDEEDETAAQSTEEQTTEETEDTSTTVEEESSDAENEEETSAEETSEDNSEEVDESTSAEDAEEESDPEIVTAEEAASGKGAAIASTAQSLIGTKFEYGMTGPETFDNPGFVYYCCKENGIDVPRRTNEMTSVGTGVSRDELKSGDILIFSNEIGGEPDFSGIYIGGGQFVSCNNENTPTKIHDLSDYWGERFIEGRRVAE